MVQLNAALGWKTNADCSSRARRSHKSVLALELNCDGQLGEGEPVWTDPTE